MTASPPRKAALPGPPLSLEPGTDFGTEFGRHRACNKPRVIPFQTEDSTMINEAPRGSRRAAKLSAPVQVRPGAERMRGATVGTVFGVLVLAL